MKEKNIEKRKKWKSIAEKRVSERILRQILLGRERPKLYEIYVITKM